MGKRGINQKKPASELTQPDLFEQVINSVVEHGFDRSIVEPLFLQLWKDGLNLDSIDDAISVVIDKLASKSKDTEIQKENTIKEMQIKKSITSLSEENLQQHESDIVSRLKAAVVIPSVVDVANALRKWYSIAPLQDRNLLYDPIIFGLLFQNITRTTLSKAATFSVKHLFIEILGFSENSSIAILQCLSSLSSISLPRDISLLSLLTEIARHVLMSRHNENEMERYNSVEELKRNLIGCRSCRNSTIYDQSKVVYKRIAITYATITLLQIAMEKDEKSTIDKSISHLLFSDSCSSTNSTVIDLDSLQKSLDDVQKQLSDIKKAHHIALQRRDVLMKELEAAEREVAEIAGKEEILVNDITAKSEALNREMKLKKDAEKKGLSHDMIESKIEEVATVVQPLYDTLSREQLFNIPMDNCTTAISVNVTNYLNESIEYLLLEARIIGEVRDMVEQLMSAISKLDKEMVVLNTLKLVQNIADVNNEINTKKKSLAEKQQEELAIMDRCSHLEEDISKLIIHLSDKSEMVSMELQGHVYSLIEIIGIKPTIDHDYLTQLKPFIETYIDSDKLLTSTLHPEPRKRFGEKTQKQKGVEKKGWKVTNKKTGVLSFNEIREVEKSKR